MSILFKEIDAAVCVAWQEKVVEMERKKEADATARIAALEESLKALNNN